MGGRCVIAKTLNVVNLECFLNNEEAWRKGIYRKLLMSLIFCKVACLRYTT